jgi:hypothetical protein
MAALITNVDDTEMMAQHEEVMDHIHQLLRTEQYLFAGPKSDGSIKYGRAVSLDNDEVMPQAVNHNST